MNDRDTRRGAIGEVFRFEIAYRLRQPSTWIYAAILLGVPFLMMHAIDGSSQFLNAPQSVMFASGILGGVGMLVSAGVFGDAAARDVSNRMYALFYTSPLRESQYALGRFLGALTVNALLLLGVPVGLLLASVMPYMPDGKFGAVQPAAYVQAYVLMLLPNLMLVGACMFTAAALTRRALATYAGGIALFVLGLIVRDMANGLANTTLAALADPFGASAIESVTRFWTPDERNAQLIGWPTIVLLNRALWVTLACGIIAVLVTRFHFAQPANVARRRWWQGRGVVDTAPDRVTPIGVRAPAAERSFSLRSRATQTLAVAGRAWREIAGARVFLVVVVAVLAFVFAVGWDIGTERFGTASWPVTHLIAGTVLSSVLGPVMAVLLAVLAGELVWRERDVGLGDIADVAPIPNSVALLGRFLALVAMLVVLQAVFMGAGMLLQMIRGYHLYEPMVYVELLFGVKLVDYVLLAALAMTVHVIVNNKYVGHLVVVMYFVSTMLSRLIGLQHRMLVFGSDPGWVWSDFNGLSPFLAGFVWFKLYWAAWALLLAVVASLFWVRGRERGVTRRLELARQRLGGRTLGVAAGAIALVLSTGGFVFYNTNVMNEYRAPDEWISRAAEYERRYGRFEGAAQPSLAQVEMRAELYPAQRAATVRGTLRFVNRAMRPIDSLQVQLSPDVETRLVRFNRGARVVVDDSALRFRRYALDQPMAPGDSLAMDFEVAFHPKGFRNDGEPTSVTPNGAYLDRTWLPGLGYQAGREITDERVRHEQGLPPRKDLPSAGDVEVGEVDARRLELVDVDATIGTDSAHVAVTPGTLVREWREKGRRYFHYRSQAPVRFGGAILSGRYATRDASWNGMPLRVYYHPTHSVNVDRMLHGMRASLAYYTEQFGPYQFRDLRIVEFPLYQSFARAHPGMITFSEGSAFLTRVDSGDVDRTFFVVAHETAHQWWGGQVVPASARGASMVSESLAQYSAMMVLETTYGRDMARRFRDYNLDEYLRGRTVFTNREAPLLDVERQNYVYYGKGAVVMYAMRQWLGADAVNGALRKFRERYAGPSAPPATSRALYAELQAVTPDSLRGMMSDLFEHITMWNVRADSARAEPDGAGAFRVTLYVDASKTRTDSVGGQKQIPMNDLVDVGVFAGGSTADLGEALYRKQHRLRNGKQEIVVTVPRRPALAGIDLDRMLIERQGDDNTVAVRIP